MMASESKRITTISESSCNIIQSSQWYDFVGTEPGSAININNDATTLYIKCCYFERCYVPDGADGAVNIQVKIMDLNYVAASHVAAKENMFGTISMKEHKFQAKVKYFSLTQTGLMSNAEIGEKNNFLFQSGTLQAENINLSHNSVSQSAAQLTLSGKNVRTVKYQYSNFINGRAQTCVSILSKEGRKNFQNINFINLSATVGAVELEGTYSFHEIFVGNIEGLLFKVVSKSNIKISRLYYLKPISPIPGISFENSDQRNESIPIDDKFMFNRYRWNLS